MITKHHATAACVGLLAACLAATSMSCGNSDTAAPEAARAAPAHGQAAPEAAHEALPHGQTAPEHETLLTLPAAALETIGIETVEVRYRPLVEEIRATAVIKPNEYRMAHVSSRIAGKALEVKAFPGDHVEPGQILALLDSLELGERKSAFLQARTNLEVARRNYAREKRLFEQQVSSEKEYLSAKGEFERSEASYRAAREALHLVGLSDEDIDTISWGKSGEPLSFFPLRAPFAGTVVSAHITTGELITPEDIPYTIADLSTVWILLDIYEKDLGRVEVGAQAHVIVEAYPGEVFSGRVTYISNLLDPTTRTAEARIEVDNRHGKLRPGMFATGTIGVSSPDAEKVLVVPRDAVHGVRGKSLAFVQRRPGAYEVRTLRLGAGTPSEVAVLDGLRSGERVVTGGGFYLKSILLEDELAGEGH